MWIFAISFVLSLALVGAARTIAVRKNLLDQPNERSSHKVPVPRIGGAGIVLATVVTAIVFSLLHYDCNTKWLIASLILFVALAMVGFIDDHRGISSRSRFLFQFTFVLAYFFIVPAPRTIEVTGLGPLPVGLWGIPIAVLSSIWLINAYNFMDGIDGLVGLQTLTFAAGMLILAQGADFQLSIVLLSLIGSACGFLVYNYPPATIFMGDVGSTAIGALIAVSTFRVLEQRPSVSPLTCVLFTLPVVFDATFTLLRRIANGERWYEAHRTHIYQRPQNWGWSHRQTTAVATATMVLSTAAGLSHESLKNQPYSDVVVLIALVILSVLAFVTLRKDKQFSETTRTNKV